MAVRTSLMEFQIPRIVHEEVEDTRGVFVIEPLDRGFGYTFGNSLRRVLLSSLEGAAVTSVKIEGVAHEFTTLPGVREDVTDILLNFKSLICRLHGESPEIEVRLTKKGAGVVKASDIEAPAELEILNPDLEIANLSDKGKLEVTLTIGRGRGYVPAELNRGPEHTIGVIPIDSIFSPVRRVSYDVEAARVGQRTDYDKLRIDVTTDGSIDPRESIGQAAEILIRQLAIFTDIDRMEGFGEQAAAETQAEPALAHGMENFPIEELELGVRSYNCLKRVGIETIGDLVDEVRERAGRDPELRQEVDRRGQGDARDARPEPARRGRRLGVRHRRSGRKLGRDASHRKALYSNLAGALFEHGRIKTTAAKAKEVKPIAEQMITLARRGGVHARQAGARVPALAGRRAQALQRRRPALRRPAGRLLPDHPDRPAAGRRGRDGVPRARRLRARRRRSPRLRAPRARGRAGAAVEEPRLGAFRAPALTAAITTPPSVTEANERAKLVSKYRQRSHARTTSSKATTAIAKMIATW